jgi:D-glycero-D-manno-heptose 1,7-bisphosphate phosphatase
MADNLIVLDRDGVINADSPDYIKSAAEWQPLPGSIDAIAQLCQAGFKVYVATNQAGLAKQKFTATDLAEMHAKLEQLVIAAGGRIERIFFCPHHPDDHCDCRKPQPGLLHQIRAFHPRKIATMVFVGDSEKDIEAARRAGCESALVLTGNGRQASKALQNQSQKVPTYADLGSYASAKIAKIIAAKTGLQTGL